MPLFGSISKGQLVLKCSPLPSTANLPSSRHRHGESRGRHGGNDKANTGHAHSFTTSLCPSFVATPLSLGANKHCFSLCQSDNPTM